MTTLLEIPLTTHVPTRGQAAKVRFWPGENSWGKNPYGKPLYRVVWAPSRTYLLGGCWGDDGEIEYRHAPYYPNRTEWVLEKWLTAVEYGGTLEEWKRANIDEALAQHGVFIYTLGPYPASGWYEHCFSFPNDAPPNLQAIVPLLEETKKLTFAQIKAGIGLWHERQKKVWEQKVEDGMREAMPAFGFSETSLGNTKPTGDTAGLTAPGSIAREIQKYCNAKPEPAPFTPDALPQRGVGMGRRKQER